MSRPPLICQLSTTFDEDAIIELQRLVWGSDEPGSHEYFRWQNGENPSGEAVTCIVRDDSNRLVSTRTLIPVPALLKGNRIRAAFTVNAATHGEFRRRGLSTAVAQSVCDEGYKLGIRLIFSVTNKMSYGVFKKKLGFVDVGRPWVMLRWINPGMFLEQHGYPRVGRTLGALTNAASRIWSRSRKWVDEPRDLENLEGLRVEKIWEPMDFCIAADSDWLKWRYRDHPFRRYEFALVGEVESPQALMVYQVLGPYKKALVMEFFAAREVPSQTVEALMEYVIHKVDGAGCSSLWCLATPHSRKAGLLRKSGFWIVPWNLAEPFRLLVQTNELLPTDFSVRRMDISYGALLNFE